MINKEQFMKALYTFVENDMLPKTEGNSKIILNTAKVAMSMKPDAIFKLVRDNTLIAMLDVIDEHDNVDIDTLVRILSDGFGSDEFSFAFKIFGKEYALHFSAADVHTIKRYAM